MQGIDQAGANDDSGAMLVIMEYRYIETFAQSRFNFKAVRCGDVFEVDAAKGGGDGLDYLDELLRRFGGNFNVEHVDPGKLLEQHGLALHHRLGGERATVAQAQDRGTVGDHGNQIAFVSVVVSGLGVFGDFQHRLCHARRVGQR